MVAAGVKGLWEAALSFDPELGFAFWTKARSRVLGAISDEARHWRRHGQGETRIERWLYAHPEATAEQILVRQKQLGLTGEKGFICHSLQEAGEWITQFRAWAPTKVDEPTATGSFEGMYSCFDQLTLTPQLGEHFMGSGVGWLYADPEKTRSRRKVTGHEIVVAIVDGLAGCVFDAGPDVGNARRPKAPEDLSDYTEATTLRFKNGKRHVTRQKAASYCYGILATPQLQPRALANLEFAKRRWQWRIKLAPQKAKEYPRWATQWLNRGRLGSGSLGLAGIEAAPKELLKSARYIWNLDHYPPWLEWNWKIRSKENSNDRESKRRDAALSGYCALDARRSDGNRRAAGSELGQLYRSSRAGKRP